MNVRGPLLAILPPRTVTEAGSAYPSGPEVEPKIAQNQLNGASPIVVPNCK